MDGQYSSGESLVQKAMSFSMKQHEGQYRKDYATPFFTHPFKVAEYLTQAGVTDQNIIAAAYLHDVVEDTKIGLEEIVERFNPEVAKMVEVLTRQPGLSREDYFSRLKDSPEEYMLIKLADVSHNSLPDGITSLKPDRQKRLMRELKQWYLPEAKKISEFFYNKLTENLNAYEQRVSQS